MSSTSVRRMHLAAAEMIVVILLLTMMFLVVWYNEGFKSAWKELWLYLNDDWEPWDTVSDYEQR